MSPPSSLKAHLGYWLRFVSNHVSHGFALKVEAEGVTVAEWVVLRTLLDGGAAAPSDVAQALGMTRGAISKLADRLVEKGLVLRTASESDRRFQALELSDEGRALVPVLAALADANEEEFFGHLPAEERRRLAETMQDIVRHHGLRTLPTH
jgi:DNA-binding MarR family transcriptional regulator